MPDSPAAGSCAPASPLDAATVLEEAADLLLINGRCRTSAYGADGSMCVMAAMRTAAGDWTPLHLWTPWVVLEDAVGARGTVLWNKDTDDDFEVIDTLRLVAKDLRNNAAGGDAGAEDATRGQVGHA